ncbi:MAG: bifunctional DNA primase/polymerase [Synechococcaceae cyanobacterium SM1_2_3]|nr:bifunctional DNA primase/polymerase [Synechococcaceae cyanobacterium SM1_2_3]
MNGSKAPLPDPWKPYQTQRPDRQQLATLFKPGITGIGAVTGPVSGNLEAFEFDDADCYQHFKDVADEAGLGGLIRKLEAGYLESSPGGGYHYLYRCAEIGGNLKLATIPDGIDANGRPKVKTLIETRGTGGFIILAPSNGKVHPTGQPYRLLAGSFDSIPELTPDERRALFTLAKTFHIPANKTDAPNPNHPPPINLASGPAMRTTPAHPGMNCYWRMAGNGCMSAMEPLTGDGPARMRE